MASPKLRFKEFDGDWCISPLKNLCKINQGLQIAIEERFLEDAENRFFYITNEFLREGAKKSYFIENPPISVRCKSEDILMTRTGNTGQVVTNVEGAFHNNFFKIDFDRKQIDKNFFVEFLRKNTTQHLILKYAGASTIPDLNHSDFYRIQMPITSIEEQTKIASFFSAVDEKISQLSQKHQLLSQYKEGMMQKLFSQQIRFKADDGSEFEEWEITTLGLTGKFIGGGTPSKKVTEFWQGSIPWISSSDLVDESIFNINITRFISTEALNQSATKLIPANSILIVSRVGVGKVAVTDKDICTSQDFTNLVLNSGNTVFFGYLIKSLTGRLLEMNQGTSIKGFVKDDLSTLKVQIPCLEEQLKIANLLSSFDQKIDIVLGQLEQAKQWKKGLLQQMFV